MRRAPRRLSVAVVAVCLLTVAARAAAQTTTTEESTTSTTDTTTSTTQEPTTSTEEPTTSSTEEPTTSSTSSTTSTTEEPTTTTEEPTTTTSSTEAPTTSSSSSTTEAPTTTLATSTSAPVASSSTTSTTTAGATTSTTMLTSEVCNDGVDNDGDELLDCQDLDCAGNPACPTTCPRAPSFPSIECRLTELTTNIETTPDIQAERARLVVRLTASRTAALTGRTACAASDTKRVRKSLLQSAKKLQQYRKRLRTKAAKRTIPAQLLTDLLEAGDALRSDVKTLRATVQCPADAG